MIQETKADAFPTPEFEACIDRIGSAEVVSNMYLLFSYLTYTGTGVNLEMDKSPNLGIRRVRAKVEVMTVLGMCGFYRRFVLTKLLTNLFKKNGKFLCGLEGGGHIGM